MKSIPFFSSGLLCAVFLFSACGGGQGTADVLPEDGIRNVRITANDQMRFSLSEITASPGEELRIVLQNVGRMPKQTMGHNWVLFSPMPEGDLNRLAMQAAQNPPDYLPSDRTVILAKTKMLGPGESDTITFRAPAEPGSYPFSCTFPGHFTLMRGNLVVR